MYDRIPVAGLTREEWLNLRKTGIGGSDAGAVCGVNPYAGAADVWLSKTSEGLRVKDRDNEAMRQGRDLEAYVAARFCEETGFKVRRSRFLYRNREHPFMIADVDRLIVGKDAGLECKTAGVFQTEQWKEGAVPPHYLIQCLHYMAVTGKQEWYLAVLILGREFKYVRLERQEEQIQKLIRAEEQFWTQNVLAGRLPSPDGTEAYSEVLGKYFTKTRKEPVLCLKGFDGRLMRREEIEGQMEELSREKETIDQELKLAMKEYEHAVSGRYRISWTHAETARVDTKRMRLEKPEVYRDYLKVTDSRRFSVRAAS